MEIRQKRRESNNFKSGKKWKERALKYAAELEITFTDLVIESVDREIRNRSIAKDLLDE